MHDTISSKNHHQQFYISLKIHTTYSPKPTKEEIEQHNHDGIIYYHRNYLDNKRCPICQSGEDIEFPDMED